MNRLPGIKYGLIGGVCLVILSMIGMVEAFNQREIVSEVISMGQMLLLAAAAFIAYLPASRAGGGFKGLAASVASGVIMMAMLALLVLLSTVVNLRLVFINASPSLFQILTFQQESLWAGVGLLLLAGGLTGLTAGLLVMMPDMLRRW